MEVVFTESRRKQAELVSELKKSLRGPFVVVKPELGAFPRFLKYSLFSTYKSFQQERAPAKDFALSWMCFIACTGEIEKALALTAPKGGRFAIVSEISIPREAIAALGKEFAFPANEKERKAAEKELAEQYGISAAALKNYSLEDLLVEKAAVALL